MNYEDKKEPYYYEIGNSVLVYWEDKWKNGIIINGYRTREGLINVKTDDGEIIWFGENRHKEYIKPI